MEKGIIYVMTTAVDGIVKIGMTTNFENRMNELERNGYYNVSGLKRKFAIEVEDFEDKEKLIHRLFSKSQVGQSELFSIDTEEVIQLLSAFNGKIVYPKNITNEDSFIEATEVIVLKEGIIPDGLYTMEGKSNGLKATLEIKKGDIILKAGSVISPSNEFSSKVPLNGNIITLDFPCTSPSMAASIVAGNRRNGWISWKDKNGKLIDEYRKKL